MEGIEMSATRDLIAAALTAADLMEGMIGESYRPVGQMLRELCARAMVQPDMAEVEKRLCIHENVVRMHANGAEFDKAPSATRAALLEYVRGIMAERDALMQTLRDEIGENLRLRELGGALPDENITAMTERLILERDQFRDAAKMVDVPEIRFGNMAIVKSVARTILHTVPGEKDCRCSQCELAKEARAIYTKWKESK
jgi:hypothetical protein